MEIEQGACGQHSQCLLGQSLLYPLAEILSVPPLHGGECPELYPMAMFPLAPPPLISCL